MNMKYMSLTLNSDSYKVPKKNWKR